MVTGSEDLESIGRALPSETIEDLHRLLSGTSPETISQITRSLRAVPPDALDGLARSVAREAALPPLEFAVLGRAMRAVTRAFDALDRDGLSRIAAEEADAEVLLGLLSSSSLMEALEEADPLAEARLRGVAEQRRLLGEAGGAVGATEAAEILGVSRQAVDARRKKGRLLAVATGRHGWRYPRCQFDEGSEDGVVRGLERVLGAVEDEGGWMRLAFLLSPEERLGGRRPLDALRAGEVEAVVEEALSYGEHGAY
jgi:hypothetical protein